MMNRKSIGSVLGSVIPARTGYYGEPGHYGGMVHIVSQGGPICGSRVGAKMEFQWCAHGVQWDYVECERCKRKARAAIAKAHREAQDGR